MSFEELDRVSSTGEDLNIEGMLAEEGIDLMAADDRNTLDLAQARVDLSDTLRMDKLTLSLLENEGMLTKPDGTTEQVEDLQAWLDQRDFILREGIPGTPKAAEVRPGQDPTDVQPRPTLH